tara:strand:+ start:179 stop:973 length:795 start_codon:yes stop_codon:yes gene_type:complete
MNSIQAEDIDVMDGFTEEKPTPQHVPQTRSPLQQMMQNQPVDPADANLLVKFFTKPIPNRTTPHINGVPQFEDAEYVDIRVNGRSDPIVRRATPHDKQRFSPHYNAFKQRTEMPQVGYPLSEWAAIPRGMVETFTHFNIKTVEQLAGVSDGDAGNIKGGIMFKQKALAFLETLKGGESEARLIEEIEKKDGQLNSQQLQIDDLNAKMSALIAGQQTVVPVNEDLAPIKVPEANDSVTEMKHVATATDIEETVPKKTRRKTRKKV